ncbi:hypothetical protein A5685_07715 [Mycobacterium colombiense]|uniref:Uncharacterized protein n=1 Tax=Mycobacterium colombiense TaxID=339268 RepID=A0A1A2RX91_9MYCO|nr:hypothetical protein A5685_07715 [Mycobacterium colombiense]
MVGIEPVYAAVCERPQMADRPSHRSGGTFCDYMGRPGQCSDTYARSDNHKTSSLLGHSKFECAKHC